VAGLTGLRPGSITFSISSLHLYERHWTKAERIVEDSKQATDWQVYKASPGFKLPVDEPTTGYFDALVRDWFRIEDLIRKNDCAIMQDIQAFPEPLMRSWLYALAAWNRGDLALAGHLRGTALFEALSRSPKHKGREPFRVNNFEPKVTPPKVTPPKVNRAAFTVFATKLHAEKNAAYGDSWKKRGEMLGIMANIARKVDRLGVPGGGDTAADTAIDLMMYLIKYNLWLRQQAGAQDAPTEGKSHVAAVDYHLQHLEVHAPHLGEYTSDDLIAKLRATFDVLEHLVEEKRATRDETVVAMIHMAYPLAVRLWGAEQVTEVAKWHAGNATRAFNYEMEETK